MEPKEVLNANDGFVRQFRGEDILPMLVVKRGSEIVPTVFGYGEDGRQQMRALMHRAIEAVKSANIDWAVFMATSYMKASRSGEAPERRLRDDPGSREIHLIQAFTPSGKLARLYDRDTLEVLGENEAFDGYLAF